MPKNNPVSGQPSPPISVRLMAELDALTASESHVARTILADHPMAGLDSISTLAARAGVSAPTVLRFASKLGFAGWPQFQALLHKEVSERLTSPLTVYDHRPAKRGPVEQAASQTIFLKGLETTLERLKPNVLDQAVGMLTDPRANFHVIGGRFSTALGVYLSTHLQMLRPNVRLVPEIPLHRNTSLLDMGRGDVVVALDFRRYQIDTIDFRRAAAGRGARIILLTDPWLSPLVGSARLVIAVDVTSPSPFDSFVSALAVLELLICRIGESMGPRSVKRLRAHDSLNNDLIFHSGES